MLMAIEKIVSEAQPRDGLGYRHEIALTHTARLIPSSILAKIPHTGIINSQYQL